MRNAEAEAMNETAICKAQTARLVNYNAGYLQNLGWKDTDEFWTHEVDGWNVEGVLINIYLHSIHLTWLQTNFWVSKFPIGW